MPTPAPVKEKVIIDLTESGDFSKKPEKSGAIGGRQIFQIVGVMAAGLVVGLCCLDGRPIQWLEQVFTRPAPAPEVRPIVLVVAPDATDQLGISGTVEPRGYATVVASNADDGVRTITGGAGEIRIVVIDSRLPGAAKVTRAVKKSLPAAHVIMLRQPRQPDTVARLLMDAL
jgi:CheY-like chemotaxis protein